MAEVTVEFDAEDMLELLKVEARKAHTMFKKEEFGQAKDHLDRVQELVLEINKQI